MDRVKDKSRRAGTSTDLEAWDSFQDTITVNLVELQVVQVDIADVTAAGVVSAGTIAKDLA